MSGHYKTRHLNKKTENRQKATKLFCCLAKFPFWYTKNI